MKKCLFIFLVLLSNLTIFAGFTSGAKADTTSFSVAAKAAISVDASSGKILYAQNATDSSTGIASITKILTAYMVYEAVAEGKLTWDTKVPISDYAFGLTKDSETSNIAMTQGESFTVKDLTNAMLIPSANSAAIALAEKIGGSEPKFVDMMRAKLKSWGITDEKLVNASGLTNSFLGDNIYPGTSASDENTMSAQDVATIAVHLLKDYPQVLDITSQVSAVFDAGGQSQTTMDTTNFMLPGFQASRTGVDGLKTGSTTLAGDSFAGTTNENGFRIITVVLKADNPNNDEYARFTAANSLMNYTYSNWTTFSVAEKEMQMSGKKTASVADGKQTSVPIITKDNFDVVIPTNTPTFDLKFDTVNQLSAPVKSGVTAARARAVVNDKLGYLTGFNGTSMDLVTQKSVERANPFVVMWNHFVDWINHNL